MNIILFPKIDWLWILFGCPKMNVYEYDYCSATRKWPNTNTKIIRLPNNDYIQISFGWSNTIHKYNFLELPKRMASKTSSEFHKVMLNSPSPLMTEANYKCKQLPIHMTHPMWLWYMRINYSFGAQSSFGSAKYSKKITHARIFSKDWLNRSSEKWKCCDKF